jgi:hypothetical protein
MSNRDTVLLYEANLPLDQRKRYQNRRRDIARRFGLGYFELEDIYQPFEITVLIGDLTSNRARTWREMTPAERDEERIRKQRYKDMRKKRPERYAANSKLRTPRATQAICKFCHRYFRPQANAAYCSPACASAALIK